MKPELTVVIPLYNEQDSIPPLYTELTAVLEGLKRPYEVIVPHRVQKTSTSKYLLYGQSNSGRYLFIVFVWVGQQVKVISARDMTKSERSYFRRK